MNFPVYWPAMTPPEAARGLPSAAGHHDWNRNWNRNWSPNWNRDWTRHWNGTTRGSAGWSPNWNRNWNRKWNHTRKRGLGRTERDRVAVHAAVRQRELLCIAFYPDQVRASPAQAGGAARRGARRLGGGGAPYSARGCAPQNAARMVRT